MCKRLLHKKLNKEAWNAVEEFKKSGLLGGESGSIEWIIDKEGTVLEKHSRSNEQQSDGLVLQREQASSVDSAEAQAKRPESY